MSSSQSHVHRYSPKKNKKNVVTRFSLQSSAGASGSGPRAQPKFNAFASLLRHASPTLNRTALVSPPTPSTSDVFYTAPESALQVVVHVKELAHKAFACSGTAGGVDSAQMDGGDMEQVPGGVESVPTGERKKARINNTIKPSTRMTQFLDKWSQRALAALLQKKLLLFLDALFHAIDGNFTQNQKDKKTDEDDFPLSLGAAYFANEDDVANYLKNLGPLKYESSTCHKFGAMDYGGHWGSVSGTLGLSCARHMFVLPGGGVDLQKGERFANVDFAMLSGLRLWRNLFMHVSAYDINCQYRINFEKRMQAFRELTMPFSSIPSFSLREKYFPYTLAGVGKFHIPAHNASCRYKFSFHFLPGVGMTDGEAPERIWATLNALGLRTREMSSGHRHDVINDFHTDMNIKRTHDMSRFLHRKYVDAEVMHKRTVTTLEKLEEEIVVGAIGADKLAEWKKEESVWVGKVVNMENHDGLKNPYEPRQDKTLTQKQLLANLAEKASKTTGLSLGLVGAIEEGIELQDLKAEILQELAAGADSDTPASTMTDLRKGFTKRVDAWRIRSGIYLTPLVDQAAGDLDDGGKRVAAEALERDTEVGQVDEEVERWAAPDDETEDPQDLPVNSVESESSNVRPTHVLPKRKSKLVPEVIGTMSTPTVLSSFSSTPSRSVESKGKKRKRDPGDTGEPSTVGKKPEKRSEAWLEVNAVLIELPSSHHSTIRAHPCIQPAVVIEMELRKNKARGYLDDLRTHLITSYGLTAKKKEVRGQRRTTRAYGAIRRKWKTIQNSATAYRRARHALLALGMPESDRTFQLLKKQDIKAFTLFTADQQLGDSKKKTSWIWDDLSFINAQGDDGMKDYFEDAVRVHWFRTSALKERWYEQILLVQEEMRRTVRFFKYYEDDWTVAAESSKCRGRAAYARKQAYRYSRLIAGCRRDWKAVEEMPIDEILAEVLAVD
ncbi:hypothetical protein EW026_g3863 [Hermanssonia centrifuga]|uniref:Uncharacterized protein n=1 Tax=Hermanssonia centrifuga TaxID=98765 RepID=A0A4V3XAI4_9APHY|nr:hypothetical protein EW026_g3863 [Hermanssonia centrifuga]